MNGNGGPIRDVHTVISVPSVYPYRISDFSLPSDFTGFVYMLVSVKDCSRTYVGQTENISKRLYHNIIRIGELWVLQIRNIDLTLWEHIFVVWDI